MTTNSDDELREQIGLIKLGEDSSGMPVYLEPNEVDQINALLHKAQVEARIDEVENFGDEKDAMTMHNQFCRKNGARFRKCFQCYKDERLAQLTTQEDK